MTKTLFSTDAFQRNRRSHRKSSSKPDKLKPEEIADAMVFALNADSGAVRRQKRRNLVGVRRFYFLEHLI